VAGGQWLLLLIVCAACVAFVGLASYVLVGIRRDHQQEASDYD